MGASSTTDPSERVPLEAVVRTEWREAVVDTRGRVERVPYELCVLGALREAIRRREIWVVGAGKWRNPETDLAHDFDLHRDVHYKAIRQPTDATEFVESLRARLDGSLTTLSTALRTGSAGGVKIGTRKGGVWITVPRPVAQPVPTRLAELKDEVTRRWGVVSLLDILKEADWLTDFHHEFATIATREQIPHAELRRKLLLVLFGLGPGLPKLRPAAISASPVSASGQACCAVLSGSGRWMMRWIVERPTLYSSARSARDTSSSA